MSHFSVLVVGPDIEGQLAPYQENNAGDCPAKYMEFVDIEDEARKTWDANARSERVWYPDVQLELEEDQIATLSSAGILQLTDWKTDNPFVFGFNSNPVEGSRVQVYHKQVKGELRKPVVITMGITESVEPTMAVVPYRSSDEVDALSLFAVISCATTNTCTDDDKHTEKLYTFTLTRIGPPVTMTLHEAYKDFETYMSKVKGLDAPDVKTGRYGYYNNPNSFWDWYEIGGRWSGELKLKPETRGVAVDVTDNVTKAYEELKDQVPTEGMDDASLRVKGLEEFKGKTIVEICPTVADFARMFMAAVVEGDRFIVYPEVLLRPGKITSLAGFKDMVADKLGRNEGHVDQACLDELDPGMWYDEDAAKEAALLWDLYVDGKVPETAEDKAWAEANLKGMWYKKEFYTERYGTKDAYVKCMANFHTYAVVKDGKWYDPGHMRMFACDDGTHEDHVKWESTFFDTFIKDLPPKTQLTVVDCHI